MASILFGFSSIEFFQLWPYLPISHLISNAILLNQSNTWQAVATTGVNLRIFKFTLSFKLFRHKYSRFTFPSLSLTSPSFLLSLFSSLFSLCRNGTMALCTPFQSSNFLLFSYDHFFDSFDSFFVFHFQFSRGGEEFKCGWERIRT